VLLSIAGGSDLGLFEINEAASLVQEAAHPEANIIFGTVIDDSLGDEVRVTVIAAGFEAGGPTHKKLEPTAFRSPERSSGLIAPGVSGSTGGSSATAKPSAPSQPPAPSPTQRPAENGHGYGTGYRSPYDVAYSASNPNQSGALPPAAPAAQPASGNGSPYTPPAPRRPESPVREDTESALPPPIAAPEHAAPLHSPDPYSPDPYRPSPSPTHRPSTSTPSSSAPAHSPAALVSDLDDDVDVPPFMRR
jgi:cell division protein FtsZ